MMDGLINILKPPGMTSHDVVNWVRRLTGIKKAGHTGTLDPAAAGVLLLCVGRATRVIEYLPDDKQYRAEITFGVKTDTGDSFGEIIHTNNTADITQSRLENELSGFLGEIEQVPPMTSAVRHHGVKLYELARRGVVVERKSRRVIIHALRMVKWKSAAGRSTAIFDVSCSAGTYIRTLCSDIGDRLGCGAHMSFLLRTRAGSYAIDNSYTLEELACFVREGKTERAVMDLNDILVNMPAVLVKESAAASVKSGARLYLPGVEYAPEGLQPGQLVRLKSPAELMAIAAVDCFDDRILFKPVKVLV
jgi:tRNA pseudouridine55 synthase